MVRIVVTFELGAECLLTVTAREMNTQRQVSVAMSTLPGPGGAQRQLESGTRTGAPVLGTGVHATVTPAQGPEVAPLPPPDQVEPPGGDRLLGKLRRYFGGDGGQG
jgi:molecular chaperone DnaK